jgi:ABC-2 type transport system ATP-binding protein
MSSVPAFTLTGVVKRYPGFTLGPLDLTLDPGTVVGFVGPNGSGKTTTLNCIAGLVVPEAGSVDVFGHPADHRAPAWKADIGVVGEAHGFYRGWTANENLRFLSGFYPGWSNQRAHRLAVRLGLPLDKKVEQLSKGHLAKLAMVAALGHGPRLLLLDEPTSGLDPVVRAEVLLIALIQLGSWDSVPIRAAGAAALVVLVMAFTVVLFVRRTQFTR